MTKREDFIREAISMQDAPYVWAAKGPKAFDCSGLVTWCLKRAGGPDWRMDHNCARLFNRLPPTHEPVQGDLVFYGSPERVTHVMIFWGDGRVYGAVGGNRDTTSVEIAHKIGARVKFRKDVNYRPGFLGFRTLAPLDEGDSDARSNS